MTTRPPLRRDRRGYSLVELLTVMVLVGIMISMAAPAMTNYVARHKNRRALDMVSADIAYARLFAIQNSRRTWLRMGEAAYTIDTVSVNGDTVAIKRVNLRQEFGPNLSTGGVRLEFTSRGVLGNRNMEGTDRHLRVRVKEIRDSMFISPTGRVYRVY